MGILNLSPLKYEIILAALLVGGSVAGIAWHKHNVHEQEIGQQRIEAADAKLAVETAQHNTDLEIAAAKTDAATEEAYENALLDSNLVPAPSLVCKRPPAPGGSGLPGAVPGSSGAGTIAQQGIPATDNGAGDTFDPSGPLVKIGHDKDAQIKALQADVVELLNEMQNGRK